MSVRFRLLTEADVRSVLTMDDLIETMASALNRFSTGCVVQPVRTVISVDRDDAFFGSMPAFVRASGSEPRANSGAVNPQGGRASGSEPRANSGAVNPHGGRASGSEPHARDEHAALG